MYVATWNTSAFSLQLIWSKERHETWFKQLYYEVEREKQKLLLMFQDFWQGLWNLHKKGLDFKKTLSLQRKPQIDIKRFAQKCICEEIRL